MRHVRMLEALAALLVATGAVTRVCSIIHQYKS